MNSIIDNKLFSVLQKSTMINRNKLFELMKDDNNYYHIIGQPSKSRDYSDVDLKFRQDSNFFWLTGIDMADCSVVINCYEKKIILVTPEYDTMYTIWCGKKPDFEKIKQLLNFDMVITKKDLYLFNFDNNIEVINNIEKLRIIKNKFEITLMKEAGRISSLIHNKIIHNKMLFNKFSEKKIVNYFQYYTHEFDGVMNLAYPTIVGKSMNASILHYTECNDIINSDDIILIDAGCEFMNYASDITTTFSMSKFNKYQQAIYDIVLNCNIKCKEMIRENVNFKDVYFKSLECIYQGLLELEIFNMEYILDNNIEGNNIAKIFMPHGLGHFMGLDVHDVGGRLYNYRTDNDDGIILKENMVITIEPGIYFIKPLLEQNSKLFNKKINDYLHVGGVRIEDDIVILKDGYEMLNHVVR